MKTAKTSKRALLCSVLSIALCLSMLIGTTFAWFTDTATTAVNTITSGKLEVKIVDAKDETTELTTLKWIDKEGNAFQDQDAILWEPGCTYVLTPFKIVNTGSLALKYKMVITGLDGDSELLDVIHFSYTLDGATLNLDKEGHLAANGGKTGTITVSATMDTTAGNKYQEKTLTGVSIKVYATQDTVEFDSTTDQYDKDATYPATTANELQDALTKGGVVNVTENLDPEATLTVSGDTKATIDATGKTIANTTDLWEQGGDYNWSLVSAQEGAHLTITGNGTFKAKENDCYAVDVQDGSTVTIEDGTFIGNIHAVYVQKGTAYIKGGFYSVQQKYPEAAKADGFVLNCYDANRANGTAKIIVTGGTFVNFNPADCWAEGAHTNFVADGYKVTSETQSNGEIWYTVVAD